MEHFYRWIEQTTGISPDISSKILESVLIILAFALLSKILNRIVFSKTEDAYYRYKWRKTQDYVVFSVGFLIISAIWIDEFKSLLTFFGLLSAGIAIALKDPVTNLAGWFFIIWRKPFDVGDRIQLGDNAGDVIDIRIFQFTIIEIGNWVDADQSTGRILHIPNAKVFTDTLANYGAGFNYIWHEIGVLVTFESDWKKAKSILQQIVTEKSEHISKGAEKRIKEASKKYMIFYKNLTPIVYTTVKDSGVMLTMRFLCDPRQRRGYEEVIWEEVLHVFAQHQDIDFAYPTHRFYNNVTEGKGSNKTE
ncbi:MAG: mechanosensitive ion channel [Cyclobacteriaceae bacterium]|nr:mechanosensitive ion channel [Cyclobacteriaceae bacterium]